MKTNASDVKVILDLNGNKPRHVLDMSHSARAEGRRKRSPITSKDVNYFGCAPRIEPPVVKKPEMRGIPGACTGLLSSVCSICNQMKKGHTGPDDKSCCGNGCW